MSKRNFLHRIYLQSKKVSATQKFDDEWQTFLKVRVRPGDIFSNYGPSISAHSGLATLRNEIEKRAAEGNITVGQLLIQIARSGMPFSTWNLRVGLLMVLLHFYRHSKVGGQDVWIYSPPEALKHWMYETIQGSEKKISAKLLNRAEIFSVNEKNAMADALRIALMCSQKTEMLGEFKHQLQHWVNEQYRLDAVKASYARYKRQVAICIQSVFLAWC